MGEGGMFDKVKGRLREAAGALSGDDDLKRKGKIDQMAGQAKDKADEVVDKAREVLTGDDSKKSSS